MTNVDLSYFGLRELPRFGKDHLALADWRLGVPHQRNAVHVGERLAYVEHRFEHASGQKFVRLEGGSQVGLPTDHDDLFLIALLTLAAAIDFPQKIHFEPSHLLYVLRLPLRDRHYRRQREAFDRLVKLSAMFQGAWFDRKGKAPNGDFVTGILSEVYYQPKQGRRSKGARPASYAIFTDNFHQSLVNGNLLNIDLELLSEFRSPTAALHYRHLNKVWHSGRKPFHYSCDLKDLACGRLHMTDGKNMKENYAKVLKELENHEYLQPSAERFEKIRRGVWRVHFDLHPSRHWRPKSPAPEQPKGDDATEVVKKYRQARFPDLRGEPLVHERKAAAVLLTDYDKQSLIDVTDKVAAKVAGLNKGDHYFGFAVPYYRELLGHKAKSDAMRRERDRQADSLAVDVERVKKEDEAKRKLHAARLRVWEDATLEERAAFLQAALDQATTSAARERILNAPVDSPPAAVLRQIPIDSLESVPTDS